VAYPVLYWFEQQIPANPREIKNFRVWDLQQNQEISNQSRKAIKRILESQGRPLIWTAKPLKNHLVLTAHHQKQPQLRLQYSWFWQYRGSSWSFWGRYRKMVLFGENRQKLKLLSLRYSFSKLPHNKRFWRSRSVVYN